MDLTNTNQQAVPHPDKTLGYSLLAIGLVFIITTLVWTFLTLTGRIKVNPVLNVEAPSIPIPTAGISLDESTLPPQIASSIKQTQGQQSVKLIPNEVFSTLLNMGIFYLLAMFVASTGTKIASIGVQLLKTPSK